jgi:hypothetical protein
MSDRRNVRQPELDLPFKPFTDDEVRAITGVKPAELDFYMKFLTRRTGDNLFTTGLEWMQTFAVFAADKFRQEGAPLDTVLGVLVMLAGVQLSDLEREAELGNYFPVPARPELGVLTGVFIPPPTGAVGDRLRLDRLYKEFLAGVRRVFPD